MTLRLLYLDIHPVPDGITEALQILQCCDGLAASGVHVELVTPLGKAKVENVLGGPAHVGLVFRPLHPPSWYRLLFPRSSRWFYRRCIALARQASADAILVRNLKLAETLLRAKMPLPIFFEAHEIFTRTYAEDHPAPTASQRRKLMALRHRETYVYRTVSGLIAKTKLLLDDMRGDFGTTVPGCVLPNGVDMRQAEVARQPRTPNPRAVALYLGSLHPWKGVETALTALSHARDVELWIAGGPEARIAELQAKANQLGIEERVRFIGHVAPDRRFELINQADICLLPLASGSLGMRYTSPLKLFEYMAMGKAIVVSDLPAIREIANEDSVCLVEPGNPAALGEALAMLARDTDRCAALGAAARRRSLSTSWSERGKTLSAFLTTTISSRHQP